MAQRRMISLDVVDTDAFLDMPVSSQLLYFHLNARADDDGFVANPRKIVRILGANEDDLKVLAGKKFIIAFQDGVCVLKHWRVNNFVRKDIYKETQYLDLKQTLFIRPNGAYTLTDDGKSVPVPKGHFQLESVNDTLTKRQPRLGKGSIGKVRKENTTAPEVAEDHNLVVEVIKAFEGIDPKNKAYYGNTNQRKACSFLLKEYGLEQVLKRVSVLSRTNKLPYFPTITTPVQLRDKWVQLQDAVERMRKEADIKKPKIAF